VLEEFGVCLASPEVQIPYRSVSATYPEQGPIALTDLEVGPEVAPIVTLSSVVTEELHSIVFGDILRVFLDELCGDRLDGV
jgi:hypothetical protein